MSGYEILLHHGVTRLCHFTKLQTLCHIVFNEQGILATNEISWDTKNVTDPNRYDGKTNYVCCSIQYPNSWYLLKAEERNPDMIFRDWVITFIDPSVLLHRDAIFSPCNAGRGSGSYINNNINELDSVFDFRVSGWNCTRSPMMLSNCPTNGQAELLIQGNIPRSLISGIAVANVDMAERVFAMLKTVNQSQIKIYIAPDLFSKVWSEKARAGIVPIEEEYPII